MRRYLLAMSALMAGIVGLAQADYLVIKYNLGVTRDKNNTTGFGGQPGMMGPGMMGPGMMGGGGDADGAGGGPGGRGFGPGAMGPGGGGMGPGAMGPGGMGPGMMGPGMMGPGMMGPGAMGPGGGMPGMGGGFGYPGLDQDANFTPLWAVGVVEVQAIKQLPTSKHLEVTHKLGGKTVLMPQPADKRIVYEYHKVLNVGRRFEAHYQQKKAEKLDAAGLVRLAGEALKVGLIERTEKIMEEAAAADKNHPAVVAFRKVRAALAAPVTLPDGADRLRGGLLEDYQVAHGDHFALLHSNKFAGVTRAGKTEVSPVIKSRLDRLEDHLKAFYYWFAVEKNLALDPPKQRLVAVLVVHKEEFDRLKQIFDSPALVADGFVSARDNLAIFSHERVDAASIAMRQATKDLWAKHAPDKVLKTMPKELKMADRDKGAEVQTIALLQKAMEEDSEIATVSHEVTRQLLAATGLQPRNVVTPEWLRFGMASFFDTPKASLWFTVGAPSTSALPEFNYLDYYKRADKAKKLEDKRLTALEKVVTDTYFRDSAEKPKDEGLRLKARALSWSLTYHLARKRFDGLLRYHQELARMPRDLDLDRETLLLTFARSFDLLDPKDPNRVDPVKLASLANQWHQELMLTPPPVEKLIPEPEKSAGNQSELRATPPPGGNR